MIIVVAAGEFTAFPSPLGDSILITRVVSMETR